jgi:hypothetical protein
MVVTVILILIFAVSPVVVAAYHLNSQWDTTNFFDAFNFETMDDPTHGYVDYIDSTTAKDLGLAKYVNGQVYIGVDSTSIPDSWSRGRKSIRLSSKLTLNGNQLVVIDLEHMPSTSGFSGMPQGCSVWPAFWTVGPDWPNNGEIDIIEYVNTDSIVATTLHTNSGCDQASEDVSSFSGTWSLNPYGGANDNCDVNAGDQYSNTGCSITGPKNAVGNAFNSNGKKGGVFAMEWSVSSGEIRAFYFPRDQIPSDLQQQAPIPSSWGLPYARFLLGDGSCPTSHFKEHSIVFDTTFCGDWAGAVFPYSCSSSQSCQNFVQYNPAEFLEAYWLLNYVAVYDA